MRPNLSVQVTARAMPLWQSDKKINLSILIMVESTLAAPDFCVIQMLAFCLELGKFEGPIMIDLQTKSAIDSNKLQVQH
jgi:hypothetical protein